MKAQPRRVCVCKYILGVCVVLGRYTFAFCFCFCFFFRFVWIVWIGKAVGLSMCLGGGMGWG